MRIKKGHLKSLLLLCSAPFLFYSTQFFSPSKIQIKDLKKCILPKYNYFDPSVLKYLDAYDPTKNCDSAFQPFTELKNQNWKILKEDVNCLARCIEGVGNGKLVKFGNWIDPGPVDCEFLEAVCWKDHEEVYGYIHTQIIPRNRRIRKRTTSENVFVILIDSMSFGMAKRSLPNTTAYLIDTFGAVEFPFLNKVGENSKPNGIALWFGKQIENGTSFENIKADWTYDQYCDRYLDNETHIFREFRDHGYKTALMEDWANTMIDSWPFCKGFEKQQVDHQIRPFFTAYEKNSSDITGKHLDGSLCRSPHNVLIEYFQQFVDAYPDDPKFGFMWPSVLAHDQLDGLRVADKDFLEFFQKNRPIFDEAFVILMGDHGLRSSWPRYLETNIGSFEKNNPYLSISVPRKFRTKKLLDVLKNNANHLQTHYDTRATLLDILKSWDQPGTSSISIPGEKGSSLFREQSMDPPRSCETLPIPQQYCICQLERFKVDSPSLKAHLGRLLVDRINRILKISHVSKICVHQKYQETTSLIKYSDPSGIFKISVKTKDPGGIHVETIVRHGPNGTEFGQLTRIDTYGNTTDCTIGIRQNKMCFCRNKL